ncbi:Sodium/glucose cotransporter [Pontiella desulfatans]|uniref:Sodium/glucose cotransporter n=1 Tax=Pontiella desulfatans TaxID=2750659 RepID=A0A6C2UEQ0_PONDE|nr:sodium:solute symporter family protein [Pontiella desulfatans]VGO17686.1 Sodium/glucose cotransporter [Pontiella desulfatans]
MSFGNLHLIDWIVVIIYFVVCIIVGLLFVKKASGSTDDYFLAGRKLPWWIAGTSIVATMFAADTPLFHTGNVRQFGLDAGWLFFIPGFGVVMAAVLFARLWRRARVVTEVELLEMRYSGKAATVFRGFNAVYGGVFKAAVTLGWVTLAMGVILESLFGIDRYIGTMIFMGIVLVYSISSGLWGVVATDFIQYIVATFGTIYLAFAAVKECGGLVAMREQLMAVPDWSGSAMRVIPDPSAWNPNFSWMLIIGWLLIYSIELSTSGGFMGQRIYASKDEKNASHSLLWFGFCYYVLNGWPWIVTGLASIIILGATNEAAGLENYDGTYPAMIVKLMPVGMLGIMGAAMIAAFMSTISTILNWGSSLMVNDFYRRFVVKGKSKHHYVWASRAFSLGLAVFGVWFAFQFDSITQILLRMPLYLIGGVLVFVFRWLWSRTNIWSEIAAMVGSIVVALFIDFILVPKLHIWEPNEAIPDHNWFVYFGHKMVLVLVATTVIWVITTLLTKPVDDETLKKFYKHTVPPGPGWKRIRKLCGEETPQPSPLSKILLAWLSGVVGLFVLLFAIGYLVACQWVMSGVLLAVSAAGFIAYFKLYSTLTHYDDLDQQDYDVS